MTREEFLLATEYFIRLVRRGADPDRAGEPVPVKPEGVAWEQIYVLANKHSLSVAVMRALQAEENPIENRPPKELWEKWEHVCRVQVMADIQQLYAWEEMSAYFSEKGLKLLPLKGLHIKKLYSETAARQMGDLDVLYEKERFKEVRAAMEELGYKFDKGTENSHHQVFDRAPVTEVELHRELLPKTSFFIDYYVAPWERAIPTDVPYIYRYSLEDEYIFMLIHSAKHFTGCGSGVRTVLDFYLFLKKYGSKLNREYIALEIQKADKYKSLKEPKGVSGCGSSSSIWDRSEDEELIINFEKTILRVAEGWFGSDNIIIDETGLVLASDGVYGSSENIWKRNYEKNARKYFLYRIFPAYGYLKKLYPILVKAPFLLPFVWLKRLFRGVFFYGKRIRAEYKFIKAEQKRKKREEKQAKKEKDM